MVHITLDGLALILVPTRFITCICIYIYMMYIYMIIYEYITQHVSYSICFLNTICYVAAVRRTPRCKNSIALTRRCRCGTPVNRCERSKETNKKWSRFGICCCLMCFMCFVLADFHGVSMDLPDF